MRVRSLRAHILAVVMPLLLVVIAAVTALGYSQARQIIDTQIHHIVASNLDQIVYALERDLRPHARTTSGTDAAAGE